jgi:hypothetical protein
MAVATRLAMVLTGTVADVAVFLMAGAQLAAMEGVLMSKI